MPRAEWRVTFASPSFSCLPEVLCFILRYGSLSKPSLSVTGELAGRAVFVSFKKKLLHFTLYVCTHTWDHCEGQRETGGGTRYHVALEGELGSSALAASALTCRGHPSPAPLFPLGKGCVFMVWAPLCSFPPPSLRLAEGVIVELSKILYLSCWGGESQTKGLVRLPGPATSSLKP